MRPIPTEEIIPNTITLPLQISQFLNALGR